MPGMLLLPLLSIATSAGALASVAQDAVLDAAAEAAGATAQAYRAPPPPPEVAVLRCPLSSGFARKIDLSTGGRADWRVKGANTGYFQKPPPVTGVSLPPAWNVAFNGAKWIKAYAAGTAALEPGQYVFSTAFRIVQSPGEMRVMLKGRVLADEQFSVELLEAGPGAPSQGGQNAEAPNPAQLTAQDSYDVDMLVGEALFQAQPSGSKNPRAGDYRLNITVENTVPYAAAVAVIAQLELTQTCLASGGGIKPTKKRTKKKTKRS
jgi:hypothetical protein